MTATLPDEVRAVFDRFLTTEYVTIDRQGRPIVWPVTPYHDAAGGCIDVTTGLGYPKKADDAAANPHVALLFSDPTGSGLQDPPCVLVQGTADVDDRDLDANRERYRREAAAKLPGTRGRHPPEVLQRALFGFYYTRIYVHVRPERVYVWPHGDLSAEPLLLSDHLEEVRSGHNEEPEALQAEPRGDRPMGWDHRLDEIAERYGSGVVAWVGPDGFPLAARRSLRFDRSAVRIRLEGPMPAGLTLEPGLACLTMHEHDERFTWQHNVQVRGDLVREDGDWALVPHRVVGGFTVPKGQVALYRENARKFWRMARRARDQERRRQGTAA